MPTVSTIHNRVARLEAKRGLDSPYASWTDEKLQAQIDELEAKIGDDLGLGRPITGAEFRKLLADENIQEND